MEKFGKLTEGKLTRVNALIAAAALAAAGLGTRAMGSPIATVNLQATGTAASFGYTPTATPPGTDPPAVIDYVASQPGTLDGYTYSYNIFLVADATGSLEVFSKLAPAGITYVPTAGDQVAVTGTYSPFNNIPEVGTVTALTKLSSGNAVLPATPVTIPELNALTASPTSNPAIQEYLLSLDNVYIDTNGTSTPAGGVFPTHANGTYTLSDGTPADGTLTMFQYASSYAAAGALGGTAIPTGPVDLTGIVDVFTSGPEFIPFSVTAVPEPASLSLLAVGGLALLRRRARTS